MLTERDHNVSAVSSSYQVPELLKIVKEKDAMIRELRTDMEEMQRMYKGRLEVAKKEIEMLKDNLCVVKKVKVLDEKGVDEVRKTLRETQKELERERRKARALETESAEHKRAMEKSSALAHHYR